MFEHHEIIFKVLMKLQSLTEEELKSLVNAKKEEDVQKDDNHKWDKMSSFHIVLELFCSYEICNAFLIIVNISFERDYNRSAPP